MAVHLSKNRFRKVFENTSNFDSLCSYLYIPQDRRHNDAACNAAEYYYDQCTQPTKVRKLIFHLDCIGDTDLADSMMKYAEPPTDSSLTQRHLIPVFQALIGDWEQIDGITIVPSPRAHVIRKNFSIHDQPIEAGKYYALYHCDPNWKELSRCLYSARETVALNIARRHIQAMTDITLTPRNIVRIARLIPLWKNYESHILDIPQELHDEIAEKYYGEKAKLELFTAWLTGHPCPTWELVRDLMMWLERHGRGRVGAAKEVEEKYMQAKRLQPISAPSYSHQVIDKHFPGICFLGEPQQVRVGSDPVVISPPGHGVTVKITPNSSNKLLKNVCLRTCLFSSVFQYPAGYTPLSPVYHITSDSDFDKEIELTFEHFAELKTDKQSNQMRFLRAPQSTKNGMYVFTPMRSGKFKVNSHRCTISTKQDGFIMAGSIPFSKIRRRYSVLCSYTHGTEGVRHAAMAISLDAAVFITHFRKVLEVKWKEPIIHRHKSNIPFNKSSALVIHQHSNLIGWNVTSKMSHSILSKEDVDQPNTIGSDYPPHVLYDITPSCNAQPSILHMAVTATVPATEFQISLEHHFEQPFLPLQDSNDINFIEDDTDHIIRDMPIKVTDWRIWSGVVTVAAPIAAVLLFVFL